MHPHPPEFPGRGTAAIGLLLAALASAPLLAASDCGLPEFEARPERFSPDAFLFIGRVLVPTVPVEGGSAVTLEVLESIHLPVRRREFDLVVVERTDPGVSVCDGRRVGRAELIETWRTGDPVKVLAWQADDGFLVADLEGGIVLLNDERDRMVRHRVHDEVDLAAALLSLDGEAESMDKIGVLTEIGRFVEDAERYQHIVAGQVHEKRIRRQLAAIQRRAHQK